MKKERLEYIDTLKGLSILCIALLHYDSGIIPAWMNTWIGYFMISTFYFTSGWLAGQSDKAIETRILVRKRLHSLGIPYLWFTIIILVFDFIWYLYGQYDIKYILTDIYKTITLRGIGTLWFLPSLFFGEIFFRWLINRNNWKLTLIATIITCIYLHYYSLWHNGFRNLNEINQIIDAPLYTIRNMMISWPVIMIGYYLSKLYKTFSREITTYTLIFAGLLFMGLSIYFNGGFASINFGYVSPLIQPVIGPLGLLLLSIPLSRLKQSHFFTYWGKNSIVLMGMHYSILQVICAYISTHYLHLPFENLTAILFFIITIICTYPIVWLFNSKLPFMLGKSRSNEKR